MEEERSTEIHRDIKKRNFFFFSLQVHLLSATLLQKSAAESETKLDTCANKPTRESIKSAPERNKIATFLFETTMKSKRLRINNIICRVEKLSLPIQKGNKLSLLYRECKVIARPTHCVIFITRNQIKDVFTRLHFAKDFANCVKEFFGVECKQIPRICNVQASKVLNIERTEKDLKEFLVNINNHVKITELGISREGGAAFEQINLDKIFQPEPSLGLFISIQAKGEGLSCQIQTKKDKQNYVVSFIFTKYSEKIQKLFSEINYLY